jgi:hypothetical protein
MLELKTAELEIVPVELNNVENGILELGITEDTKLALSESIPELEIAEDIM